VRDALTDLASAWATESNGRVEVHGVAGDVVDVLGAVGASRARVAAVDGAAALAVMAWTAASGGAHGRRRGMAAGRFAAWWCVAALCDRLDDWPVVGDAVDEATRELSWFVWDVGEPETGWVCRLAVVDDERGEAWAIAATDAR
jgi:hypothetical protein